MSGGFFDYKQFCLQDIVEKLNKAIQDNDSNERDEYGSPLGWGFKPEIIERLKDTIATVEEAHVKIQRADWLLSGDDGEESYLERLDEELTMLAKETSNECQ